MARLFSQGDKRGDLDEERTVHNKPRSNKLGKDVFSNSDERKRWGQFAPFVDSSSTDHTERTSVGAFHQQGWIEKHWRV